MLPLPNSGLRDVIDVIAAQREQSLFTGYETRSFQIVAVINGHRHQKWSCEKMAVGDNGSAMANAAREALLNWPDA